MTVQNWLFKVHDIVFDIELNKDSNEQCGVLISSAKAALQTDEPKNQVEIINSIISLN